MVPFGFVSAAGIASSRLARRASELTCATGVAVEILRGAACDRTVTSRTLGAVSATRPIETFELPAGAGAERATG